MTNELEVLGLFLEEYVKAKEEMNGVDSVMNDIFVTDKTSIHVFEGDELVGIYTKETGVPKIHVEEDYKFSFERAEKSIEQTLEEVISNLVSIWDNMLESIKGLNPTVSLEDLIAKCESQEEHEIVIEGEEGNYTAVEQKKPKGLCRPNWQASEFNRITSEMLELYSRKNTDYGGSFDESLDEDGLLVAKIRLKDKLNRFSQLIDNDGLVEDESLRDTLIDLANYSVMTIMWLDDEKD